MFQDGLIHLVDIRPVERNLNNRSVKGQIRVGRIIKEDVPCRIVKDEKVMFPSDVHLKVGDVLYDKSKNKEYQVVSDYKAIGFIEHHRTYKVNRKNI